MATLEDASSNTSGGNRTSSCDSQPERSEDAPHIEFDSADSEARGLEMLRPASKEVPVGLKRLISDR